MRRLAMAFLAIVPLAVLLMAAPAAGSASRDPVTPGPGVAAPTPPLAPVPTAAADPMATPDPAHTVQELVGSVPPAGSLLAQLGLFGAPAASEAPSAGTSGESSSGASASASAASAGSATESSSAARRTLRAQPVRAGTGTDAVLRLARSSTALIALLIAAVVFLLVQGRLDRRAPQLASAPLDRRQDLLEFS